MIEDDDLDARFLALIDKSHIHKARWRALGATLAFLAGSIVGVGIYANHHSNEATQRSDHELCAAVQSNRRLIHDILTNALRGPSRHVDIDAIRDPQLRALLRLAAANGSAQLKADLKLVNRPVPCSTGEGP